MPYIRITSPDLPAGERRRIAERITAAINDLFFEPHSPISREELRERTTVHFTPYGESELFIGGRTPQERGGVDVTLELSDWNMSLHLQRKVAASLTEAVAELFSISQEAIDQINIRFHPYPPRDFAVGGQLLRDRVPLLAQFMKRLQR